LQKTPFAPREKASATSSGSEQSLLHSMRHTALTRLGEAGVRAFEIMKIAGHSSVTMSQKYVHPSPESIGRAFERLEAVNIKARAALLPADQDSMSTTNPTTLVEKKIADSAELV